MEQERQIWLCFFLGMNVFGKGKISMLELERKCKKAFEERGLNLSFLAYYYATGNIGVLGDGVHVEAVKNALFQAIGKTCAIIRPDVVNQIRLAFESFEIPPSVAKFRWTRGVSLLCDGEERNEDNEKLFDPDIGFFKKIAPGIVIVYRLEKETERGTLDSDPKARKGGWTAVSRFTGKFLGGLWTARSLGTLGGMLDRVNRELVLIEKRKQIL